LVTREQERWAWFIDVLFGAIAAIALEQYESVVRQAWNTSLSTFVISVVVAVCICAFFVYDIAAHHVLVKKHPYHLTYLGFVRFYLDLVMAFILYVLLRDALSGNPGWFPIVVALTFWHGAAIAWHLLVFAGELERRRQLLGGDFAGSDKQPHTPPAFENAAVTVFPHVLFIGIYWLVVAAAQLITRITFAGVASDTVTLLSVSVAILVVAVFRWRQVVRDVIHVDTAARPLMQLQT
jgi:hypothetical protein